ncbi:MAG: Flagellar hook-associated protein 1 [Pseudomonadota bacterium]|jgi:flagellar hook-associated protein FlgK
MPDISSIASGAVVAYQRALGTVSNNIANAATEGYSRQVTTLEANPVSRVGQIYFGNGVAATGVSRAYDSFIEANYRNSNSDLLSQEPMVNYTNRIVDVMGSDSMGLSSALDQFFNTARLLSTDPASTALRGSFMADAGSVASRFAELSSQLDLVQEETAQAISSHVSQINTITSALAQVNLQLTKQRSLAAQPADLLDQRDLLLKNLSDFVHVNARFTENGAVTVSLGPSFVRDVVVEGGKSFLIGTETNPVTPEKISLVLDPYGKSEPLVSISSGKLAGLLSFREQVLGSSRAALDNLANVFANEVNQIQNAGIDAYGNLGANLFRFDPAVSSAAGGLQVAFEDPLLIAAAAQFRVAEAANNTSGAQPKVGYSVEDFGGPALLKPLSGYGLSNLHYQALVTIGANNLLDQRSLASALQISDASAKTLTQELATKGLVNTQISTLGSPSTLLSLTGQGYAMLDDISVLPFNVNPDLSRVVTVTESRPFAAIATIPSGLQDISLFGKLDEGQNIQVFTRDGRQILGSPIDSSLLGQVLTSENGFAAGASYSTDYLNQSGSDGYKDLTVFYGARAAVRSQAQWDTNQPDPTLHTLLPATPLPALLEGRVIPTDQTGTVVAAGALVLNGTSLGALSVAAGSSLQASDIRDWINDANISGITASASNVLRFTASQVSYDNPLTLNGETVTMTGVSTLAGLVDAINSTTASSHLIATVDAEGKLLITNAIGYEGDDIEVTGTIPNALGLDNGTYTGRVSITRALVAGQDTPIELGFGADGSPDDLRKIGMLAGAHIVGQPNEDLLVFVTGAGQAKLSATYSGNPQAQKDALRQQQLQIVFDSPDHYSIIDVDTNTELASQSFDPGQLSEGIHYQGLHISFNAPPAAGDIYTIDGNRDGAGNNQNMLDMADLQKARVMGGGKTLGEAYIDQVNEMGNVARQATIAQSALKVVNDQAVSARDQVAGVSMDQEAADLIRFQQAYQASAKVLQVASELFDSILQVR